MRIYKRFFQWKASWLRTPWILCLWDLWEFYKVVKTILQLKSWVNRILGAGSPLQHIPAALFPTLSVWTRATCASKCHQRLSCASCHSRKDPMKGVPPHSSCHPCRLLWSLSSVTAWLTPFPLSAPLSNVTCHQSPFYLRWDPAAGCPVVRTWRGRSMREGGVS